jgi:hypothetical protein
MDRTMGLAGNNPRLTIYPDRVGSCQSAALPPCLGRFFEQRKKPADRAGF